MPCLYAQATERRSLEKERAQLDAEREMLQVQQEECAAQAQKVRPLHLPNPMHVSIFFQQLLPQFPLSLQL